MHSSVITFPGSNCDRDMDVALKKFGFKNKMVWHDDVELPKSDLVVLPGGFSYGDYLRCGSMASKSKIMKSVLNFAQGGGKVMGICNGFQILVESGLLPGVLLRNKMVWHDDAELPKSDLVVLPGGFSYGDYLRCGSIASKSNIMKSVINFAQGGGKVMGICNGFQILVEVGLLPGVLLRNKYLEFICKNVFVKVNNKDNSYFKDIKKEIFEFHIAHNEGNYFCSNEQLKVINDNNQIALQYSDESGNVDEKTNPNGSIKNIAGIFNKEKNVLGMMPHPERMIDKIISDDDGANLFLSLLN